MAEIIPEPIRIEAKSVYEALSYLGNHEALKVGRGLHQVMVEGFSTKEALEAEVYGDISVEVIPFFAGAGGSNFTRILMGVIIVVVAYYAAPYLASTFGAQVGGAMANMAMGMGINLILGGIMGFFGPKKVSPNTSNSRSERANLMAADQNTVQIGTRIPILYGKHKWYGHLISVDIDAIEKDREFKYHSQKEDTYDGQIPIVNDYQPTVVPTYSYKWVKIHDLGTHPDWDIREQKWYFCGVDSSTYCVQVKVNFSDSGYAPQSNINTQIFLVFNHDGQLVTRVTRDSKTYHAYHVRRGDKGDIPKRVSKNLSWDNPLLFHLANCESIVELPDNTHLVMGVSTNPYKTEVWRVADFEGLNKPLWKLTLPNSFDNQNIGSMVYDWDRNELFISYVGYGSNLIKIRLSDGVVLNTKPLVAAQIGWVGNDRYDGELLQLKTRTFFSSKNINYNWDNSETITAIEEVGTEPEVLPDVGLLGYEGAQFINLARRKLLFFDGGTKAITPWGIFEKQIVANT